MRVKKGRGYAGWMKSRFKFLNSEMGLVGLVTLPASAIVWLLVRRWRRSGDEA